MRKLLNDKEKKFKKREDTLRKEAKKKIDQSKQKGEERNKQRHERRELDVAESRVEARKHYVAHLQAIKAKEVER